MAFLMSSSQIMVHHSTVEFQNFAEKYDFEHRTSSPCYPQSNGMVENVVRVVKALMRKCVLDKGDPFLALLDWRNTPSETLGFRKVI